MIGAALDGAPRADGELPLIEPGAAPIKERVALPDIDQVVPRSTVLNLLADGDDADAVAPEALAALQQGLDDEAARVRATSRLEDAFEADSASDAEAPGEASSTTAAGPDERGEQAPFAAVAKPDRRPATVPPAAADAEAVVDDTQGEPEIAARGSSGAFRIQLAAVPPGEEQATFERLERRFGDALAGLAPRFQAISTDSGVLVRVQAAGFASEDAASAQCERIRAAGGDCFVVAGSG